LVGAEFGKRFNHYLAYNIPKIDKKSETPQQIIDSVNQQGGFGFLAHPFDSPTWFNPYSYAWKDWSVTNYTGLCLWNYYSQIAAAYNHIFKTWHSQIDFIPENIGPPSKLLKLWDQLSLTCKISVIGGSDSHGHIYFDRLDLSYRKMFKCINTHIVSDRAFTANFFQNAEIIYACLKTGSSFIGLDYFQPSTGFRFWAENKHHLYEMGDEKLFQSPVVFTIKLPAKACIQFIRNGLKIEECWGQKLQYVAAEPGVYRVEVLLPVQDKIFPWIYTNPIYLRKNPDAEEKTKKQLLYQKSLLTESVQG
jgi:hypothetical protein